MSFRRILFSDECWKLFSVDFDGWEVIVKKQLDQATRFGYDAIQMSIRISRKARSFLYLLLVVFIVGALFKASWDIIKIAQSILMNPNYVGDEHLFVAVGRAILNGLTPYVDIFENKPPAIFLLHALSLRLTDSGLLTDLIQVVMVISIPVLSAMTTRRLMLQENSIRPWIALSIGFLFGTLLVVFISAAVSTAYPEGYGVFFGIVFVSILAIDYVTGTHDLSVPKVILLALTMMGALGFKETFLLLFISLAILWCYNTRDILHMFLIPFGIAILGGIILLFSFGYFEAYVGEYIPYLLYEHNYMIGNSMSLTTPTLMRVMFAQNIPTVLGNVSILLPPLIIGIVLLYVFFVIRGVPYRTIVFLLLKIAAALYMGLLAIHIAGTKGHHIGVGVPLFYSFYLLFIIHVLPLSRSAIQRFSFWCVSFGTITTVLTVHIPPTIVQENQTTVTAKQIAYVLDNVLDNCGVDRYMRVSVIEPEYGYAKHSSMPLGLLSTLLYQNMAIPMFNKKITDGFRTSKIVLLKRSDEILSEQTPEVVQYLRARFDMDQPSCAGEYELPGHLALLFRKDSF